MSRHSDQMLEEEGRKGREACLDANIAIVEGQDWGPIIADLLEGLASLSQMEVFCSNISKKIVDNLW